MRLGRDAINPPRRARGFKRKAHHDVGGGKLVSSEPRPVVELLLQIVEMKFYLGVDESARRPAERAKPVDDELQKQGGHQGAFGVMHPVAIAPISVVALSRRQSRAISIDKIVDDGAGLGEAQRTVLDDRRLSQGMDEPQAGRSKHRLRVPLVADNFVVEPDLFKEPQDTLRAEIVQMMDLDHGMNSARCRGDLGHTTSAWTASRDLEPEGRENHAAEGHAQADDERQMQHPQRMSEPADRRRGPDGNPDI